MNTTMVSSADNQHLWDVILIWAVCHHYGQFTRSILGCMDAAGSSSRHGISVSPVISHSRGIFWLAILQARAMGEHLLWRKDWRISLCKKFSAGVLAFGAVTQGTQALSTNAFTYLYFYWTSLPTPLLPRGLRITSKRYGCSRMG